LSSPPPRRPASPRLHARSCGYAKGGAAKAAPVGAVKIGVVMKEFGKGKLHSGSDKGPLVKNPKQAIAIGISEARKAGARSL
jgi:hypothetical protein